MTKAPVSVEVPLAEVPVTKAPVTVEVPVTEVPVTVPAVEVPVTEVPVTVEALPPESLGRRLRPRSRAATVAHPTAATAAR